ncbi:hypothetical protein OG897_08390 [Streptomyces sp. NBC_00237]|uniref:hypothetical protein n=1 Tax=Streptomyces sp. NBC_00237 TaxID=2975687 RepID=UPI00225672CC|nr:hypothetical protein [Streptomyces sp. NBC_00237]MCX5201469.1 hypothetical protein [Streptomyces sp. NBC_00237]
MLDGFWKWVELLLKELEEAKSASDVMAILKNEQSVTGAFFPGSGGDETVWDALEKAGWEVIWSKADHHYAMRAPDGTAIQYVEGDVYLYEGKG